MKNWTINEAVEIIQEGTDVASMKEIASFNPIFFKAVCQNDIAGVTQLMGEKFTMRKLSKGALEGVTEDVDAEVSTDENDEAAESNEAPSGGEDLNSMTAKELIAVCAKRGIKVPKYGKNKQFYLEALTGAVVETAEEAPEADDNGEDEAEEVKPAVVNPYEGKNAMSLYKMCKDRGIKAEPRQKAKVYLDLLVADDAAKVEPEPAEDEDWAEEEEAEEKHAKSVKSEKSAKAEKSTKPTTKETKAAKKAEPADDEEWNI